MSKKYVGKTCVYCAEATSTSGDHVFAREFFLKAHRGNLPQVPACDVCNRVKSELEHYFVTLLPFGARHPAAEKNLREQVPRRIAKNRKLQRNLAAGWGRAWSKERGVYVSTATLPVDSAKLQSLFALIVKGLIWFHWKTLLGQGHFIEVMALTEVGERFFEERVFGLNASARVDVKLGDGTVRYEGVQGVDVAEITAWRIFFYGGLRFGDPQSPGEVSSTISAWTGPESVRRSVERRLTFGPEA